MLYASLFTLLSSIFSFLWDRIKGLKLRRFDACCGCLSTRGAAVHEVPQYMREKKSLSCPAAAAVDEPRLASSHWLGHLPSLVV